MRDTPSKKQRKKKMNQKAKSGDQVEIHFVGMLKDQTEVMSTQESGPFPFTIGDNTIFKKIGEAVVGMTVGEQRQVKLQPRDAFGTINNELIFSVPIDQLPSGTKKGTVLVDPNDDQQEWLVTSIENKMATLDGNHPLAGEVLLFNIQLVSIS